MIKPDKIFKRVFKKYNFKQNKYYAFEKIYLKKCV